MDFNTYTKLSIIVYTFNIARSKRVVCYLAEIHNELNDAMDIIVLFKHNQHTDYNFKKSSL